MPDLYFYYIGPDFLLTDLELCAPSVRTLDITIDALWKNDRLLQNMGFWESVRYFPGSNPAKWDFGKFCRWLSWKSSDIDKHEKIYEKLSLNPTIRILDISSDGRILKVEFRKRKLEVLRQV